MKDCKILLDFINPMITKHFDLYGCFKKEFLMQKYEVKIYILGSFKKKFKEKMTIKS